MGAAEEREHFAIIPRCANPEPRPREDLDDAVLGSYGVSVIRVDKSEISDLLRGLYLSADDVAGDKEWTWEMKRDREP